MIEQAIPAAAIGPAAPEGGASVAGVLIATGGAALLALTLILGVLACAWLLAHRSRYTLLTRLRHLRGRSLFRIRRQLSCSTGLADYREQLGRLMAGLMSERVEERLLSLITLERLAQIGVLKPVEHNRLLCLFLSGRRARALPQAEPEAPGEDIVLALRQLRLSDRRPAGDGINLGGCDLRRLVLPRADLSHVVLTGANLDEADLSEGRFRATCLARTGLRHATLRRSVMPEADLFEADLRGANLSGCELGRAVLGGARLAGADLAGANLMKANLRDADLSRATLAGANLAGADLTGARLAGADLTGARLRGACLHGTDLAGTMLLGATGLTQAQLDGAQGDHDTTLPPPLTLKLIRRPALVPPVAA